jgi:hypothetical protein
MIATRTCSIAGANSQGGILVAVRESIAGYRFPNSPEPDICRALPRSLSLNRGFRSTATLGASMAQFNPDTSWKVVE